MPGARYSDVFQRLIIDPTQQVHINIVGLKRSSVLSETYSIEPGANLAHACSCSNSDFASLKTGVSKPSVNDP
jgi:hypothetical protein